MSEIILHYVTFTLLNSLNRDKVKFKNRGKIKIHLKSKEKHTNKKFKTFYSVEKWGGGGCITDKSETLSSWVLIVAFH